jgi:hypothetical protein
VGPAAARSMLTLLRSQDPDLKVRPGDGKDD